MVAVNMMWTLKGIIIIVAAFSLCNPLHAQTFEGKIENCYCQARKRLFAWLDFMLLALAYVCGLPKLERSKKLQEMQFNFKFSCFFFFLSFLLQ
jgi:hypothetical protein